MRFWDSSAIVPLLVDEPATRTLTSLYEQDPGVAVWWSTHIECVSAICRREREHSRAELSRIAYERLRSIDHHWSAVPASEQVKTVAIRLLRVHPLRAADALQLAAAFIACDGSVDSLPFVCCDARLAEAASKEGFSVLTADPA